MVKNVSKWIMLLGAFAFLLTSCSTTRRSPSKNTTIPKRIPSPPKTKALPKTTTPPKTKAPPKTETTKESRIRKDIVNYARQFEGAKYKYGGNGPHSFDCSGLTCQVYKKFNIEIPRTSGTQASIGKKIPQSQAKPGDLAFFSRGSGGGKISHVALVVANSKEGLEVIHSTSSRGVIIENINRSTYWRTRLMYIRNVIGK